MCQRYDDKEIQKILDEIAEKIGGEAERQVREKIARAAVEGEPIIALTKDWCIATPDVFETARLLQLALRFAKFRDGLKMALIACRADNEEGSDE